ncbi:hypothetical protein AGOR_G00086620 [Albula goreensis]|uniref:Calponin-homology (CH) domain-containing protein n=1 Tax=Albula goreensis TaxID=1534307 RepID=A0A8T3DKJ9_9TELE|nr:hypothetical protein AGOR_G00086620 [Albula goreensis]
MASGDTGDPLVEEGTIPLDIDNIQMLLQVEQEQIQKRTFTNWINAQLSKRAPPSVVSDLFADLHDGTRLLDLLEVVSGQRLKREKGQGLFQSRSNIETALNFLKKKSIKLVNIHIPDIIDGRPSIVLGLIWSIILHCHIEELASSLSFSSRQSSLESLASMDSSRDSPVQPRASPLHAQFRLSAKKALLLWVREQCDRASCSLNIKDFKSSWRSGVAFLAILHSLRPDLVDLSQAETRTNQQNLEEAFRIAEQELRIPRLLEPEDVDIQDPDEKSIMTYVAQFLQYSKEQPAPEAADAEASANQKRREVTCWLQKTYQELVEAWASTEGGRYVERYQAFQMSARPFEDQRRHILPMLSSVRGPAQSGEEAAGPQTGLGRPGREVGRWLLQVESALTEGDRHTQDHARAAQEAREKRELLKTSMKELDLHLQTLQTFPNKDEYGSTLVPADKLDQLNRRFTSARVTAKYHGMKLDYWECRHSLLELLAQADSRLRSWRAAYNSQDAVHLRLQDWHEAVDKHGLVLHLKAALHKMKEVASNYTSKAALAEDSKRVSRQLKEAEVDTGVRIEAVIGAKSTMERILSAWDTYNNSLSSVQAWLGQEAPKILSHGTEVTPECLGEWSARHAHLNEVGNYLTEVTEPGTSRALAAQLQGLNKEWAVFINKTRFAMAPPPSGPARRPPAVQSLTQDATLLMTEQVEVSSGPLRAYRKKLQLMMKKVKDVDLDALAASPDWSAESQQKLRQSVHEVTQELCRAEQASDKLQRSASALESRLAELQHWETEAQEVYQLLKEGEKRGQRGHLPKAKALIARGLHLEGQLVAEEQDYVAAVTAVQSSGPLLCLSVSELQDRVRHSLAQAQEAVGMLSSVGTRRHQGPAESQPPPKILILSPTEGQPLIQAQSAVHPQSQTTALHQHHIEIQYQSQIKPQHHIVPITQPQTDPKPEHQTDPKPQHSTDSKSKPERQTDTKPQHHVDPTPKPQAPVNPPPQSQPVFRPYTYAQAVTQSHSKTTIQPQGQSQTQSFSLTHSEAHIQTQTHSQVPDPVLAQNKPQPQFPQAPHPTQPSAMTHDLRSPHSQPRPQPQPWPYDQAPFPPNPQASTRPKDRPQSQAQVPLQVAVPASVQALPCAQPQTYIQAVPTAWTDTQSQAPAVTGPSTKTYTEALTGHPSCTLNKSPTSTFPQVQSDAPRAQLPQWHTVAYAGPLPQAPTVALRGQTQPGVLTRPNA